jgi:hypothetical protein
MEGNTDECRRRALTCAQLALAPNLRHSKGLHQAHLLAQVGKPARSWAAPGAPYKVDSEVEDIKSKPLASVSWSELIGDTGCPLQQVRSHRSRRISTDSLFDHPGLEGSFHRETRYPSVVTFGQGYKS